MIIYNLGIDNFPETCCDCPLCSTDEDAFSGWCCNQLRLDLNDLWYKRNVNCPLIKVADILPIIKDKSDELQINDIWDGSGD